MTVARCRWLALLLVALLWPSNVRAGGLYLLDRGARPLARGGAFVAGADDPGALWYNPAGLAAAGNQVLTDATLTLQFAHFQRTDASGEPLGPKVQSAAIPLPIPTLAFSHDFGLKHWVFGAGIFAPNTVLQGWPRAVRQGATVVPAPSRYSLVSMKGSAMAALSAGAACHIGRLSIGADIQVQTGRLTVKTVLPGCDQFACAFPEDPEFDSVATLDLFPAVGVSGALGVTYALLDRLRIAASVTFPYSLSGYGRLDVELPSSPIFANARVRGSRGSTALEFPWIARVGSEIRLVPWLRVEGAFVYEAWSTQREIPFTPKNVVIENIRGIGDYEIGPAPIPRHMRDTWSVRGGYEAFIPRDWMFADIQIVLRGGIAYEKSAFPRAYFTPLTLDTDKLMLSGGLGIGITKRLRFDTVAGWFFMADPRIRNSAVYPPNTIRPPSDQSLPIGNGNYDVEAFYLGGGFAYVPVD